MTERPVFSECVIGYRSWKLDDWVLSPVSFGSPWRPGVNKATCKRADMMGVFGSFSVTWSLTTGGVITGDPVIAPEHAAPKQDCACGLHAYHELPEQGEGIVIGAVAAWGNLQVHSNGFRAEHAQIVALVAADGLEDVAALYGVPLVPRDMLAMEAHQHGQPLPDSMRPEPPKPVELDFTAAGGYFSAPMYASLFTQMAYGSGYTTGPPATRKPTTWQSSHMRPDYSDDLWTPAQDTEEKVDALAKYRKPPANRQGPDKPKRAPRKLGGPR